MKEGRTQVRQLKNVRMMWHLEYYDGPMSGVLFHENEMCYFQMPDEHKHHMAGEEIKDKATRKHVVYGLSDDDKIRLTVQHALWQAHVGLHSDYWPLDGRSLHREEEGVNRKVPSLHYGPRVDTTFLLQEYRQLKQFWMDKNGAYVVCDKEPFGWVYHSQLYGNSDKVVEVCQQT